jgi:hypothetical protein
MSSLSKLRRFLTGKPALGHHSRTWAAEREHPTPLITLDPRQKSDFVQRTLKN